MSARPGKLLISIQADFWESLPINSASGGTRREREAEAGTVFAGRGQGDPTVLRSLEGRTEE